VPATLFRRELCWAKREATDAVELIRDLARELGRLGLVRPSFEAALLAREQTSPTGLPLPGRKLAVPHTDPEHVIAPAVAICTLASPVAFREMGCGERSIPVDVVAMLALPDHQTAQRELVSLIERFQHVPFVERLCGCTGSDEMLTLLATAEAS